MLLTLMLFVQIFSETSLVPLLFAGFCRNVSGSASVCRLLPCVYEKMLEKKFLIASTIPVKKLLIAAPIPLPAEVSKPISDSLS